MKIEETISHYRILSKIGEGGMGVVYLAEDEHLGRRVALKFLHDRLAGSRESRTRFLREAHAAGSLDHSNICHIYDLDEVDGQVFLAMAYLEGESLARLIRDRAPIPPAEAVSIGVQIAEALVEAHRHGVTHRDIKPSNIIVTEDGTAKLLDFGLASLLDETRITHTGDTPGTVPYMSPEQARGERVGPQTDLWSLGVVLYEMLTGERVFIAEGLPGILNAVLHQSVPRLRSSLVQLPQELDWIVARSLERDTGNRYQSAEELLTDLKVVERGLRTGEPVQKPSWVLSSRTSILILIAGILGIAAAAYFATVGLREQNPTQLAGQPIQVTSDVGLEGAPEISIDGSRIAYSRDTDGQLDIHVIAARGGSPLRITDSPSRDTDPTWIPDGSGLLYASDRSGTRSIWKTGLHGEGHTLIVGDAEHPAISPDGSQLAFARAGSAGRLRIHVARMDALDRSEQITDDEDGLWGHSAPAWSPDGELICYATAHDLWAVPARGGTARRLTTEGVADSEPVWSRSGKWVYFASYRENTLALWRVRARGGMAERLTLGSGPESHPSISGDGSRLVYTTQRQDENVIVVNLATGDFSEFTGLHDDYQPAIGPDGEQVVFVSDRWDGTSDLWIQELRSGKPFGTQRRLSSQPGNAAMPTISPDGQWVAYYRILGQERDIWTVHTSGGAPRRFTDHPASDIAPAWSPDGSRLAFVSERDGTHAIYIAAVSEGQPVTEAWRLTPTDTAATFPTWTIDGTAIAYLGNREGKNQPWMISVEPGSTPRLLYADVSLHDLKFVQGNLWLSGIFGVSDEAGLKILDLGSGELANLDPPFQFPMTLSYTIFDVDAQGRYLTYSRALLDGDIWVLIADPDTF